MVRAVAGSTDHDHVLRPLDREVKDTHLLVVTAYDVKMTSLSSSVSVTVQVKFYSVIFVNFTGNAEFPCDYVFV